MIVRSHGARQNIGCWRHTLGFLRASWGLHGDAHLWIYRLVCFVPRLAWTYNLWRISIYRYLVDALFSLAGTALNRRVPTHLKSEKVRAPDVFLCFWVRRDISVSLPDIIHIQGLSHEREIEAFECFRWEGWKLLSFLSSSVMVTCSTRVVAGVVIIAYGIKPIWFQWPMIWRIP